MCWQLCGGSGGDAQQFQQGGAQAALPGAPVMQEGCLPHGVLWQMGMLSSEVLAVSAAASLSLQADLGLGTYQFIHLPTQQVRLEARS